jgi:hypothetical protein
MTLIEELVTTASTEEWDQDVDTLSSQVEPFPDEEEYDEDGIAQRPPLFEWWEW